MKYNWQQKDWPNFSYDLKELYETLALIGEKIGLISGSFAHLSEDSQTEAMVNIMVEEAIKTSEIEGEYISRPDIRSSIKNQLGLNHVATIHDRRAKGIAELMLDVRKTFKNPLTQTKLFNWHLMLLGSSINPHLKIATWRTHEEPMQIISGPYGREIVHFEAPSSKVIPKEMKKFLQWFNNTMPGKPKAVKFAPVRTAIAHLYFESIHPFEDGNGRIGRAIAQKALSQGFNQPVLLSLSEVIEANKKKYYDALKEGSKSNDITAWIKYFVNTILEAQKETELQINFILKKTKFFNAFSNELNERQLKVIRRMMQSGTKGFTGGMSAKKYMSIADTSKATATRDLQHLLEIHALRQIGSGRSVRYELNL